MVMTMQNINQALFTAQKMKFSITDFFSKCDQIRSFLRKSVTENFIFFSDYYGSLLNFASNINSFMTEVPIIFAEQISGLISI